MPITIYKEEDMTTFPSMIRYKDDSFSMAKVSFVDNDTLRAEVLNIEDLKYSLIDLVQVSYNDDNQIKHLSGYITDIEPHQGYYLIRIKS